MTTPTQITLPMPTLIALEHHPEMFAELEAAREAGGTAGMIEWLDAHGLPWHEGRTDPTRALADAMMMGGDEFSRGMDAEFFDEVDSVKVTRTERARKGRRKAQRTARRRNR